MSAELCELAPQTTLSIFLLECFLSIPTVVGVQGAETVLEIRPHLNYAEAQKYDATADTLEHMCAQLPPAGPMTRTDALDAGAARKEAYEEAA